LVEIGVGLVREEMKKELAEKAKEQAEHRLLDLLLPPRPMKAQRVYRPNDPSAGDEAPALPDASEAAEAHTREILLDKLRKGDLDTREVDVEVRETNTSMMQVFSNAGIEEMGVNIQEMFGRIMPPRTKRRKVSVAEARKIVEQEALQELIDMDAVVSRAIERTEMSGIVFLDEIDKIAGRSTPGHGPDVSREGVQRDILPIVEGSTVTTKYGPVRTDHILFIAAGAFHMTKVSDLIPELQGRFPIRVELKSLGAQEFARILREPQNSLIRQYKAMLATEGIEIEFTEGSIEKIAQICQRVNEETENIGARRLHTIMEYLLEDLSFEAPHSGERRVVIDEAEVETRLEGVAEQRDLTRYIL
jgi:ATP-dependent HslUV protease ATP-binding subunit HslU